MVDLNTLKHTLVNSCTILNSKYGNILNDTQLKNCKENILRNSNEDDILEHLDNTEKNRNYDLSKKTNIDTLNKMITIENSKLEKSGYTLRLIVLIILIIVFLILLVVLFYF
jgi:hypothetical protein